MLNDQVTVRIMPHVEGPMPASAAQPTISRASNAIDGEMANLGERLVRFGSALQEKNSTMAELANLASVCGIRFRLRAVAENTASKVESSSQNGAAPCV